MEYSCLWIPTHSLSILDRFIDFSSSLHPHVQTVHHQSCCVIALLSNGRGCTPYISVCRSLYPVGRSKTSVPSVLWSESVCLQNQGLYSPLFTAWDEVAQNQSAGSPQTLPPENQGCTQSKNPVKTSRPTSLPHAQSQCQKSLNRSVIQYQLSSPSTRCQSLVLCWWAVRRCCSGGVLASSQAYCSGAPGKKTRHNSD